MYTHTRATQHYTTMTVKYDIFNDKKNIGMSGMRSLTRLHGLCVSLPTAMHSKDKLINVGPVDVLLSRFCRRQGRVLLRSFCVASSNHINPKS